MAIQTFEAVSFLVFKRRSVKKQLYAANASGNARSNFHVDFCDGINIVIGENGVGKTSMLRMMYAACEWSNEKTDPRKTKNIHSYFGMSSADDQSLKNYDNTEGYAAYTVKTDCAHFEWSLSHHGFFDYDKWIEQEIQSVFIPTTEMLSHANGFLALNEKFNMPFDGTQVDIIVNAELPPARKVSGLCHRLLEKISNVIDGEVVYENDTFYVKKTNGNLIEFSLEAEGFRKFALLWKLLRNGLLTPGSILFWDEPEANINPELIPTLVDILLELQRNGVQIFLATHSYNLARYFDVSHISSDKIRYISLYKEDSEIVPYEAEKYIDIKYNSIEFAGDKLFDAIVAKASEDIDDGE
ncbi:AAA family ATPase [Acutalibacter muris]|jgi:predicted ATPase|uniref:AAA family ATPase n=1 Tax=Acutalibacter muris TaxID=1796620 RepID=UPI001C3EB5EC|nr:AAA family ATPase [Acutalibacter muris]